MKSEKLKEILESHKEWKQSGGSKGKRADLVGAYLRGADLRGADLGGAKEDFFKVLDSAKSEVDGLLKALIEGRVDGTVYEGECACLVGTIANVRGCNFMEIEGLKPDSSRTAEKWFLAISKGHTPEKSQIAAITVDWISEWKKKQEVAK